MPSSIAPPTVIPRPSPLPRGSYAFGNSGRNILDAPGLIQVNLALDRNFVVTEKSHLQIRWEVFNVLNHPNFNLPNVFVNAPNGATITSANDPRLMQFGL